MNVIDILIQCAAAYFSTVAFAAVFQCPWKLLPLTGIPGLVSWITYYLLKPFIGLGFSMFAGALLLTLAARFLSARFRCPLTVFLVAGIIPLVPGSGVFLAVFYLLQGNFSEAGAKAVESFLTCGAILLGITFISMIPQVVFSGRNKNRKEDRPKKERNAKRSKKAKKEKKPKKAKKSAKAEKTEESCNFEKSTDGGNS